MTASATARVRCEKPGRYARSLAARFAHAAHTDWDDDLGRGHLMFTWDHDAEVDMIAGDGVLLLHLECSAEDVNQLEAMVGTGVVEVAEGFGAESIEVQWKRPGGEPGTRWVGPLSAPDPVELD